MKSQKEKIWQWIIDMRGSVDTNQIREWGHNNFVASPDKRVRELFAEGRLTREWISEEVKSLLGYNKDVMVYRIPKGQMQFSYPTIQEKVRIE